MANFTKQAIKTSFLKLLNENPLNKITVRDIVEDCGINRNSFYYHFQDIPALLGEIIAEQTEQMIREYPTVESIEQCFEAAFRFARENRRAVMHIYDSVSRDVYIESLLRLCDHLMRTYVESAVGDRKMNPHDRELLVGLYRSECFGEISAWIMEGMQRDILQDLRRICELRSGMTEEFIRRSVE